MAAAYLLAAIIDAAERLGGSDNEHRAEVAAKAAFAAMASAGATEREALDTVKEMVLMHRRSAENLEQTISTK